MWCQRLLNLCWICFAISNSITGDSRAQESPRAVDGLVFRDPFSSLSAREVKSKLVVLLITDEDPLMWTKEKLGKVDENRLGGGPDVWCGPQFRLSFHKLFERRPDLKDRCIAQRLVAGLPSNLNAGTPSPLPPRAIVAICDGSYRLLDLAVGVPQPEDLLGLVEDAQENLALLNLHEDDPGKVGSAILDRSKERVRRVYREMLTRLAEQYDWDDQLLPIDDGWIAKFVDLVSDTRPSYLFDVKLRFGLSDSTDLVRLLVLEQHCETREDWCDSLIPSIVGRPMQDFVGPLAGTVWGMPVAIDLNSDDHTDLLRWFKSQRENSTVVLSILPHHSDRKRPWPPRNNGNQRNLKQDWSTLERVMSNHPFRTVTAEELSVIIRENGELPISLLSPSPARYLFYEPGKNKPWVIRESDTPGKFINRLDH